jgi:hypothetical protein
MDCLVGVRHLGAHLEKLRYTLALGSTLSISLSTTCFFVACGF